MHFLHCSGNRCAGTHSGIKETDRIGFSHRDRKASIFGSVIMSRTRPSPTERSPPTPVHHQLLRSVSLPSSLPRHGAARSGRHFHFGPCQSGATVVVVVVVVVVVIDCSRPLRYVQHVL